MECSEQTSFSAQEMIEEGVHLEMLFSVLSAKGSMVNERWVYFVLQIDLSIGYCDAMEKSVRAPVLCQRKKPS